MEFLELYIVDSLCLHRSHTMFYTIIIHKGEIENVNPRYKLGSILVIYYALHIKQY